MPQQTSSSPSAMPAPSSPPSPDEKTSSTSFAAYSEYNKTLRTWFVAFGIGGPTLLLVNPTITAALVKTSTLRQVVLLFLAGTGCQILGAVLNKFANWYVYEAYGIAGDKTTLRARLAEFVTAQMWPDILFDATTICTFAYAMWIILTVFA